jgi:hypothetical protein
MLNFPTACDNVSRRVAAYVDRDPADGFSELVLRDFRPMSAGADQ